VGVPRSSSSHCRLSTKRSSGPMVWEDDGVLAPSLKGSSGSTGWRQASGSDSGESGESGCGSSMKFVTMYWDRRSRSQGVGVKR